jgi:hypothetical protein
MTEEQKKEAIRKFLENSNCKDIIEKAFLEATWAMCASGSNIVLVNSSGKRAKSRMKILTKEIDKLKNCDRH